MTILLASSNAHKAQELQDLFSGLLPGITITPYSEIIPPTEIIEDGATFAANAYIKARHIHALTGLPTLADDSGLIVDPLAGAPGVQSARYSPEGTDAANRARLLNELRTVPLDQRQARFACVLCYVDDLRTLWAEGTCEGMITSDERGDGGFGYDPLFMPVGQDRTFAQLSRSEKDELSHRGAAARAMAERLSVLQTDIGDLDASHHVPMRDAMIHASVAVATGDGPLLREVIGWCIESDQSASMMYEAILQSYLFTGYPLALDAMIVLRSIVDERLPDLQWAEATTLDVHELRDRGEALCRQVYGSVYERMMERFERATPELREWLELEGYGKVLSRPGLPMLERELCIIAMLAALGRDTQLHSHVRGAVRFGATMNDLEDCADIVVERVGRDAGDRIMRLSQTVLERA